MRGGIQTARVGGTMQVICPVTTRDTPVSENETCAQSCRWDSTRELARSTRSFARTGQPARGAKRWGSSGGMGGEAAVTMGEGRGDGMRVGVISTELVRLPKVCRVTASYSVGMNSTTLPPTAARPEEDRARLRRDVTTIGLIGLAHGTSHFHHLLLPPLFPAFIRDFGLSYSELGLLVTVFFVISGVGQALSGFLVDRVGARPVLFGAIVSFLLASLAGACAQGYGGLVLAAALAGLGNAPFHPADFTILNRRVSPQRLGHAFSVHGISGNLGWALAPVFLIGLSGVFGSWRAAYLGSALVAAVVLAVLWLRRADLEPFDLPAYRDVLMLHALVRDLPAGGLADGDVPVAPASAAAQPTMPAVLARALPAEPAPLEADLPTGATVDLLLPLGEQTMEITLPQPHLADRPQVQAMLADWVFSRVAPRRSGAEPEPPSPTGRSGGRASQPMRLDLDLSEHAPAPREFTRPAAFTDIDIRRDRRLSDLGGLDEAGGADPLPSRR